MKTGDEIHILHPSVLDACNAVVLEDLDEKVYFVTLADSNGNKVEGARDLLARKHIHEGLRSSCPECRDREPMDLIPGETILRLKPEALG